MEENKEIILYRNLFEEDTVKGSFTILKNGMMSPKTKNVTIWGLASSSNIPEKSRNNPNIVTALRDGSVDVPTQLPAFFKFQKSPISTFTESVGMEIASRFNTKTCYNCPAKIDKSPDSLYQANSSQIETSSNVGTMIYSFLSKNEELICFNKIGNVQDATEKVMSNIELIDPFLKSCFPLMPKEQFKVTAELIKRDYAYQYLVRDYMGDIDYTSKNSGIVINRTMQYAKLAPNFDFGEAMNILVTSKFQQPKLQTREDFPEYLRDMIPQSTIDNTNAKRLEKYNASIQETAEKPTLESSDVNIKYICKTYPDVAERFRQDLEQFTVSGQIEEIIDYYYNFNKQENLITPEQSKMCTEFLRCRGEVLGSQLSTHLSKIPNSQKQPVVLTMPETAIETFTTDNFESPKVCSFNFTYDPTKVVPKTTSHLVEMSPPYYFPNIGYPDMQPTDVPLGSVRVNDTIVPLIPPENVVHVYPNIFSQQLETDIPENIDDKIQ